MDILKILKAIIILDINGERLLAKHASHLCLDTRKFERSLFAKTKSHRMRDQILQVDECLVSHRFVTDLHFYVVGSRRENPLILDTVMNCLIDSLTRIANNKLERSQLDASMAQAILALDEIYDNDMILETDPNLIVQRVLQKDETADESMVKKLQSATGHLKFPWYGYR